MRNIFKIKKLNILKTTLYFFYISFIFLYFFSNGHAVDLTSTNFIVRDPIIGTGGDYGTSSSFKLYSAGNTLLSGVGSSATYIGHYGFLYYPFITLGTLSAVASGADANLSWPVSAAGQGWTVSGYNTGKAAVSGGPYTYTSVGNVTSYSYTGLTPGNYCFVLQTLDGLGNVIGTSNESCITIRPTLTFSIPTTSINFGTLSSTGPRYANATTGSATDVVAHTMQASSNASSGYVITYKGPTLTFGTHTINVASSVSGDGSAGIEQFGMSLSTTGSATIPAAYQQSGPTRTFVDNTTTSIASTSGITSTETFSNHYLANISPVTEAGPYSTTITFIATGTY